MIAVPTPNARPVGGATMRYRMPAPALGAAAGRCPSGAAMSSPAGAALAAVAWNANQAITRQVSFMCAWADLLRRHAQAVDDAGARHLAEGPFHAALRAGVQSQLDLADSTSAVASDYGRRFGHLAFAFPVAC
jgi:hypothetical protein